MEYMDYIDNVTNAHTNSKGGKDFIPLGKQVPLLGPRFIPPSYSDLQRRDPYWNIKPASAYLRPIHVIHPFYYPGWLDRCPQCNSEDTSWQQWTTSRPHHVHGLQHDETVIGIQLQCKKCKERYGGKDASEKGSYCFAMTNHTIYKNREHWEIPRK